MSEERLHIRVVKYYHDLRCLGYTEKQAVETLMQPFYRVLSGEIVSVNSAVRDHDFDDELLNLLFEAKLKEINANKTQEDE